MWMPRPPSILVALLLAGCPRPTPEPPGPCPDLPCDLLSDAPRWEVEGVAAAVRAGLPEAAPRVEVVQDFEGAELPGTAGGPGASIAGDPGARHLHLSSEGAVRARWRSAAIPVAPGRRYDLSWRQALLGLPGSPRLPKVRTGVSIEFFTVPKTIDDVDRWLGEGKNATRAHRVGPDSAVWRPAEGRAPWRREQHIFRAPRGATHLRVVTIAAERRKQGGAGPALDLDDLRLTSSLAPAWSGRGRDLWVPPGASPLQVRARAAHPAHRHANEIRDAVLAPAPSTLRRTLRVPEDARLDLGYGLGPGDPGPAVTFEASLVDASGATHVLHHDAVRGGSRLSWRDASVDMRPWAGQQVTLVLRTLGRDSPADPQQAAARSPEARALWTTVRLEPRERRGRLAVLVLIDTLGAHHASGWEGERETTPNLQRIGAEGTVYLEARAPAPWTLPSSASYLTGLNPDQHGAGEQIGLDHWSRRPLLPGFDTLAERLRSAGWDTRAWINNTFLTAEVSGLDQGFSRYVDYGIRTDRGGSEVGMDAVVKELRRSAGDRFLFVHLMDPHLPYRPPLRLIERFADPSYDGPLKNGRNVRAVKDLWSMRVRPKEPGRQHLLDLHEAAIAYADEQVGRVYDAARATGSDLMFVVVSDHGEEFWEHGAFDHGHSLFDELLHVPLVSYRSERDPAVISSPVDATGVFAEVLGFAGLDAGDAPTLPRQEEPATLYARPTLYGVQQRSVEVEGWKYIVRQVHAGHPHRRVRRDPIHLLFDRSRDPKEKANRMKADPDRARALHRLVVQRAIVGAAGAWFLWIGPGEAPVDAMMTMRGGDGWQHDVTDLPWPSEDGSPLRAPLGVKRTSTDQDATVTLAVRHRPTLILMEAQGSPGEVTVTIDGVTRDPPAAPIDAAGLGAVIDRGEGSVLIGRLRGRSQGGGDAAPDDRDIEALRALGYMD